MTFENEAPCNMSSSDEEYDDDYEQEVELGFVSKVDNAAAAKMLHETPDWSKWDGGKVGGKPIWLNPRAVPTAEQLACAECALSLSFLVQIYCPLDDEDDAFHRSIYVFCCRNPQCSAQGRFDCVVVFPSTDFF